MFDLVILAAPRSCLLARRWRISATGGKVVAIGAAGSLQSVGAARTVDASNQIVIPGGVDPHIHCSMPIPFPGRNEDL